jgi:hypothetical protein
MPTATCRFLRRFAHGNFQAVLLIFRFLGYYFRSPSLSPVQLALSLPTSVSDLENLLLKSCAIVKSFRLPACDSRATEDSALVMAAGSALRTLQVVRPASISHLRSLPKCQRVLVNAAGPIETPTRLRRHGLRLTPRGLKQGGQQAIGCGKEMNWVLPKRRRRRCSSSIRRPGFSSSDYQVQEDAFQSPMRAIASRCRRPSRKLRSLEAAQFALGRMLLDHFTNNGNAFNSRFSAGMPQSSESRPQKHNRTLKHLPSPCSAFSNHAGAACSSHKALSPTGFKIFARCSTPQAAQLAASHVLSRGLDFRRELSHRGRTALQAVRVEDLSPMAPQPEEQEAVDVKVPVGFVGETSDQVFSVQKVLPPPSVLLTVSATSGTSSCQTRGLGFVQARAAYRCTRVSVNTPFSLGWLLIGCTCL